MLITEVYEKLSSSPVENVLALKGYSRYRLCYFVPYLERIAKGTTQKTGILFCMQPIDINPCVLIHPQIFLLKLYPYCSL